MRILRVMALVLVAGVSGLNAADVRDLLGEGGLWQQSADDFMKGEAGRNFRWLSTTTRDAARCPPGTPLTCFDLKVWEAVVRFEADAPKRLEVSVYNRGDAGDIAEEAFLSQVSAMRAALDAHAGAKGADLPDQRVAGKAKLERAIWVKDADQFVLTWSSTGRRNDFRAEYIQLEATPYDAKADPRKARGSAVTQARADMLTPEELKAKVTRKEDGAVYIADVPMVDQGQKGYCAVATAERILRHYGTDVDQHVIAQLANSSAGMGTDPVQMMDMLKKAGVKFGVKVKILYGMEWRKLVGEFRDYSKFAKRAGKREVSIPRSGVIMIDALYAQLDPETYRQYRTEKLKRDYETFQRDIRKYVDLGVPLAWSVQLGLFPEPGLPQAGGGHMRLIIGYDTANSQIVYTDSWGARHEYKTMPMDQAWTITCSLCVMTTRKTN
jgi:hypothetical protein